MGSKKVWGSVGGEMLMPGGIGAAIGYGASSLSGKSKKKSGVVSATEADDAVSGMESAKGELSAASDEGEGVSEGNLAKKRSVVGYGETGMKSTLG